MSNRDKVRLMRIQMPNVDDMKSFLDVPEELKLDYCTIILENNT